MAVRPFIDTLVALRYGTLNEDLTTELPDAPHDENDNPFDADVTIACGTLHAVIGDLVHELGGQRPQEGQA